MTNPSKQTLPNLINQIKRAMNKYNRILVTKLNSYVYIYNMVLNLKIINLKKISSQPELKLLLINV